MSNKHYNKVSKSDSFLDGQVYTYKDGKRVNVKPKQIGPAHYTLGYSRPVRTARVKDGK